MDTVVFLKELASRITIQSWETVPTIVANITLVITFVLWAIPESRQQMKVLPERVRTRLPVVLVVGLTVYAVWAASTLYSEKVKEVADANRAISRLEDTLSRQSRFALPNELAASYISGLDVRLVDMAREDNTIRNKTFDNVNFYGPAVVVLKNTILANNVYNNSRDITASFIPSSQSEVKGAIVIENSVIRNSNLFRTGFLDTPEGIETIKKSWISR